MDQVSSDYTKYKTLKTCSKEAGANVEVFGEYWDIADKEARSRITDDSGKIFETSKK